jgi:hypothetical protein
MPVQPHDQLMVALKSAADNARKVQLAAQTVQAALDAAAASATPANTAAPAQTVTPNPSRISG